MKEDVKAAFKKAITQFDAREEAADHERKKVATARQEFEVECKRIIDQVIVPTLKEIGDELQQSGWVCRTVPLTDNAGVKFEVYRGNMMAGGGAGRPYIAFVSAPDQLKLGVTSSTQSVGQGRKDYPLGQAWDDFVSNEVLRFFQQLASERQTY
jgi:hypothetical protein